MTVTEQLLISGKATLDAGWHESLFGQERMFLRLPGWLDEKVRAAAELQDISAQAFIRLVLAAVVGGPDPDYLDRWRASVRQHEVTE